MIAPLHWNQNFNEISFQLERMAPEYNSNLKKKHPAPTKNHVNLNDHAFLFGEGNDLLTIKTAFLVIERTCAIHSSSLRKAAQDLWNDTLPRPTWKPTKWMWMEDDVSFSFISGRFSGSPRRFRRSFPIFSLQSVERTGQTQLKPLKWLRRSCLPHHAPSSHLFSGFTQSDLVGCFFLDGKHWTSNKTKTSVVDPTS